MQDPPMEGNDVYILQNLVTRTPTVPQINASYIYDEDTSNAVLAFQKYYNM